MSFPNGRMLINMSATIKTMRKKRNEYEIIYAIMSSVADGATISRIIYQSNMSYNSLKKYLKMLVEKDLIYKNNYSKYFLTEKGLMLYDVLEDYIEKKKAIEEDLVKMKEMLGDF